MSGMVVAVREWGRWLSYWAPALVWMGIIFFLSGRTADELGGWFPFLPDLNWGHLVGYLVLAVLVRFALKRTVATPRPGGWAVLIGVLYGISDEFHQYFVPSRSPDVKDLAVDAVGALLGVLLVSWLEKRNTRAVFILDRRR
ncbi:hypothetical protein SY88_17195 [Clostridiales bacterium PH28_bin88]|nr:hypothetical protein SY88_17195 [Clostridiales bacterium PH28_bin88]